MINIVIKIQIEGLHHWPECPIPEVSYLKDLHRHVFHMTCKKMVTHSDRDIEIIQFKHNILEYLNKKYWNDNHRCLLFGRMSCEDIAQELYDKFEMNYCEVLEDGENGAEVRFGSEVRVVTKDTGH